jgi:hypothetical protein
MKLGEMLIGVVAVAATGGVAMGLSPCLSPSGISQISAKPLCGTGFGTGIGTGVGTGIAYGTGTPISAA